MKILVAITLFILSVYSYSAENCVVPSRDDVDIIYINGIGTTTPDFEKNVKILKEKFLKDYKGFSERGSIFNPSWGLAADVIQSLSQIETEFIVHHSDQNFDLMLKDVRELSFLMRAATYLGKPGDSADLTELEAYYLTHGKFPKMTENDLPHALGNNYAFKMLKRKYELDTIHFYENQFKNSLPDVHDTLWNRLYNNLVINKPFVLLGHSQGTIVAKQAYNVLLNSLIADNPDHFQKDLFGRYEIASMNEWNSTDQGNSKADYMVLWSDWIQRAVRIAMLTHSSGNYYVVGPSDPGPEDYDEDIYFSDYSYFDLTDWTNWRFYDFFEDPTGHGVANYTKDYDELVHRNKARLDSIIGSLRVCNKPVEPKECVVTPDSSGQGGYHHFEQDLGNLAGKITWEFDAYTVPDAINMKLNGEWIRVLTSQISGKVSGEFFIEAKDTGTNILDVYILGNETQETQWSFKVTCPS